MNLQEVFEQRKTFYVKKCQSNGYYPIDKYVWDETNGAYHCFGFKKKDWGMWFENHLEFILKNNPCLISLEEFTDTDNYEDENKPLVTV